MARKAFALICVIVSMVGCTAKEDSQPPNRAPLPKLPAAAFTSIEYKIRLAVPPAGAAEAREILFLVSDDEKAPADDKEALTVKVKRCVQVELLDGPDEELRAAGYVLRRRAQLEDRECNGIAGLKGGLTLERRSENADDIRSSPEWRGDGAKREEDILIGRGADGKDARQSTWSLSLETETPTNPSSVKDVRESFPGALPALPGSLALSRGCRTVFERRWEIVLPKEAPAREWKLTTWYRVEPSGRPGAALIAELSFNSDIENRAAAEAFLARALSVLGNRVGAPESSTEAIYRCGSGASPAQ